MIGWLYVVPNLVTVALISCLVGGLVTLAPFAGRRLLREDRSRQVQALEVFKMMGPLLAVFLGFSLNQVIARFQAEEQAVSAEAVHIYNLDRSLLALRSEAGNDARAMLRDYLQALIDAELPALFKGRVDPAAGRTLTRLVGLIEAPAIVGAAKPQALGTVVHNAEQVVNDRLTRLNRSRDSLPRIYWRVVLLLLAILVLLSGCLEARWSVVQPIGFYAMAIGVLVSLVAILDEPLRGETNVGVSDFQNTATLIRTEIASPPL